MNGSGSFNARLWMRHSTDARPLEERMGQPGSGALAVPPPDDVQDLLNRRRTKLILRGLLSLGVSALFITFSLRHTHPRAVAAAIGGADPWPILTYLAILLVVHLVRTVRWKLLLEPLGVVRFAQVNSACAIGFMLLMTLPLRLGELARPVLISRPGRDGALLPRSGAMASVVVERIVDSLGLGLLGIVSLRMLAASGGAAQVARQASVIVVLGFAVLCGVLIAGYFMRERVVRILRNLLQPISHGLSNRVAGILDRFLRGLHLGSPGRVLIVLVLTGLHWTLHAIGFWVLAGAFGLHLSLLMAGTVLAVQAVGIMVPAGPGMVGTSQFFTQLGLSIFIPGALTVADVAVRAAAYANTIWLLQFGQQALLGLIFVLADQGSLSVIFKGSSRCAP
jgi:uncharacterized protein (TIRG00374 family)